MVTHAARWLAPLFLYGCKHKNLRFQTLPGGGETRVLDNLLSHTRCGASPELALRRNSTRFERLSH